MLEDGERSVSHSRITRHLFKLPRLTSVEDYQHRLVETIKKHIDRNKKQWELKLEDKANTLKGHSTSPTQNKTFLGESLLSLESIGESSNESNSDSDQSVDDHLPIRVTSLKKKAGVNSGEISYILRVDISSFLPDGSVTFRNEEDSVVICGENVCKTCSSSGEQILHSVRKVIKLDGLTESSQMKVHPGKGGFLEIQIFAISDSTSEKEPVSR